MTNIATGADIEMRTASFSLDTEQAGMLDVDIPYAAIGDPDKLLLTGLAETDVAGIAERLVEYGITDLAVASLVYPPRQDLSDKVFERSTIKGTEALVHDITGNGHGVHQAIGVSEGGSQIITAASSSPDLYGQVLAIAPLINSEALGKNPRKQKRELLTRFGQAGLEASPDAQFLELLAEVTYGLKFAESQDPKAIVTALGDTLKIYIGDDDVVVPPKEAKVAIGEDAIIPMPGMDHPTLLNEAGCRQAALIMQMEWTAGVVR